MRTLDTLGERLHRTRSLARLSARALDELAGLTPGHVSAIEKARRRSPNVSTVSAIARVLGASLDWLASGAGRPPSPRAVRAAVAVARRST